MIVCQDCGYWNYDNSKVCSKCNSVLDPLPAVKERDPYFVKLDAIESARSGFAIAAAGMLLFFVPYLKYLSYILLLAAIIILARNDYFFMGKRKLGMFFVFMALLTVLAVQYVFAYLLDLSAISTLSGTYLTSTFKSWFHTVIPVVMLFMTTPLVFFTIFSVLIYNSLDSFKKKLWAIIYASVIGLTVLTIHNMYYYSVQLLSSLTRGNISYSSVAPGILRDISSNQLLLEIPCIAMAMLFVICLPKYHHYTQSK